MSESSSSAASQGSQPGLSVLVVDDDPISRHAMQQAIQAVPGMNTLAVGNGWQALECLQTHPGGIDCVVTALNMPEMNGVDLLQALFEARYRGAVAYIRSSVEALNQAAHQCLQRLGLPLIGELERPVGRRQIEACLQRVGEQRARGRAVSLSPADVETALAEDEFFVVFQPKVSLLDWRLLGLEALLRWNSREHGPIAPAQACALARQAGLQGELRDLVVQQIRRSLSDLHRHGLHLPIALNLAQDELEDFQPQLWQAAFQRADLMLAELLLEIPLSGLLNCDDAILAELVQLRRLGIQLCVSAEDASGLSQPRLAGLPLLEYKLPYTVLAAARRDERGRRALSAMVEQITDCGLLALLEGIENRDDLKLARELGVDGVQGYAVAHPMRAYELSGWCRGWQARHDLDAV